MIVVDDGADEATAEVVDAFKGHGVALTLEHSATAARRARATVVHDSRVATLCCSSTTT